MSVTAHLSTPPSADDSVEILARSYTYLRIAMVAGLIALGVSVVWQTGRQHWHLLDSVSAYYFTSSQPIFVGSLLAVGTAMIALRGLNMLEEIFLDLGGMLAFLVAFVPTSRGPDFESAVRLCRGQSDLVLAPTTSGPDCPTINGLVDATRANVENSLFTLLIVGALGLLATVLLSPALRPSYVDRQAGPPTDSPGLGRDTDVRRKAARERRASWLGVGAATLVYLVLAAMFLAATGWFVRAGHTIGALGLFACIVVVALANAGRTSAAPGQSRATQAGQMLGRSVYGWIAILLVVVAGLGSVLWVTGVVTVFWVEIAVALLFALFWTVQTVKERPL